MRQTEFQMLHFLKRPPEADVSAFIPRVKTCLMLKPFVLLFFLHDWYYFSMSFCFFQGSTLYSNRKEWEAEKVFPSYKNSVYSKILKGRHSVCILMPWECCVFVSSAPWEKEVPELKHRIEQQRMNHPSAKRNSFTCFCKRLSDETWLTKQIYFPSVEELEYR